MKFDSLIVDSPSRVHINSLKMNMQGGYGCGGVGFSLPSPNLKILFTKSDNLEINAESKTIEDKCYSYVNKILDNFGLSGVKIDVLDSFSPHIGLGSGTQLGLNLGLGISKLYGFDLSASEAASLTGRAGVSGIGYFSFKHGGLIVDNGYRMGQFQEKSHFGVHSSTPPNLVGSYDFPSDWRVLLLMPDSNKIDFSIFDENNFFEKNTPILLRETDAICADVLMGLIPSVQTGDYFTFLDYLSNVTSYGTKRIENELNKPYIELINSSLSEIIANELVRDSECSFFYSSNQKDFETRFDNQSYSKQGIDELSSLEYAVKYPNDKLPFISLSSLGPSLYSVLNSQYHNMDLIESEVAKKLPSDWTYQITSVRNSPAEVYYE